MLAALQQASLLLPSSCSRWAVTSQLAGRLSGTFRLYATDDQNPAPDTATASPAVEDVMQRVSDILRSKENAPAFPDSAADSSSASTMSATISGSSWSPSAAPIQQQHQHMVGGHPKYGYAALGGVEPDDNQDESNLTHLQLHPERQFRHGDTYTPMGLTTGTASGDVSWLPARRRTQAPPRLFLTDPEMDLDYKNLGTLLDGVTSTGRLRPRRETRLKPRMQARLARSVKLARQMALMPYSMAVGPQGDPWLRQRMGREAEKAAAQQQ